MRHLISFAAVPGLLLAASLARADVTLVADPSPPFSGTLQFGDFNEDARGQNERYRFSGQGRNDAATTIHLLVRARADGLAVAGSQQSFALAPGSSSAFNYDFTYAGHPSPATVGLEFEAQGGTVSFVAGLLQVAPTRSVPLGGPVPAAALISGLALMTFKMRARPDRASRRRD